MQIMPLVKKWLIAGQILQKQATLIARANMDGSPLQRITGRFMFSILNKTKPPQIQLLEGLARFGDATCPEPNS